MERAAADFQWSSGHGSQAIYRYSSIRKAARTFRSQLVIDTYYPTRGSGWGPWVRPADLTYESSVADAYRLLCGRLPPDFYKCTLTAYYEEYFIVFDVDVDVRRMNYECLEEVLRALDERMAHYLGKELTSGEDSGPRMVGVL